MNCCLCYIFGSDMKTGLYNFTIEQGTTFKRTFTWKGDCPEFS